MEKTMYFKGTYKRCSELNEYPEETVCGNACEKCHGTSLNIYYEPIVDSVPNEIQIAKKALEYSYTFSETHTTNERDLIRAIYIHASNQLTPLISTLQDQIKEKDEENQSLKDRVKELEDGLKLADSLITGWIPAKSEDAIKIKQALNQPTNN